MRTSRLTAAVVATTAIALVGASGAGARPTAPAKAPKVVTLNDDVIAPFQLAVGHGPEGRNALYVADGGTSTVSRVRHDGTLSTVATFATQPGDVAGLALSKDGRTLAWTSTAYALGQSWLNVTRLGGATTRISLSAYEKSVNPDRNAHYGIKNPTPCQVEALKEFGGASYTGIKDSHPYSVTRWGNSWVVADAGANALLKVDGKGHVSTLAVLPPQPATITAAMARELGVPSCVVGATYAFEPVPTDVEVGPEGRLYVTTLPGGPEGGSTGARGSVYRVNPWSGRSVRIATGFAGATNLALAGHTIYVAELFGGRISTVSHGKPAPYVTLPSALSVEYRAGHLYAGTLAPMDAQGTPTGKGRVVEIRR